MRASRIVVAFESGVAAKAPVAAGPAVPHGAAAGFGPVVGFVAFVAVVLMGLAACGSSQPPVAPAPKGPTACARASDSMVQTMLDRLSSDGPPPTEAADALRNLIRERCEQDNWSVEATKCLIAMKSVQDAEPCAQLMTEDQQAALVRDEAALFGPTKPDSKKAAAPSEGSAPGEPATATQPAVNSEKPDD